MCVTNLFCTFLMKLFTLLIGIFTPNTICTTNHKPPFTCGLVLKRRTPWAAPISYSKRHCRSFILSHPCFVGNAWAPYSFIIGHHSWLSIFLHMVNSQRTGTHLLSFMWQSISQKQHRSILAVPTSGSIVTIDFSLYRRSTNLRNVQLAFIHCYSQHIVVILFPNVVIAYG